MTYMEKFLRLQDTTSTVDFRERRFEHCKERMSERHFIEFTYEQFQQINFDIFTDNPERVAWLDMGETANSSLYVVTIEGVKMLVAYAEDALVTLTVMPRYDARLKAYLAHNFVGKAMTDADYEPRNRRRELAERLKEGTVAEAVRGETPASRPPAPVANTPFKNALANFVPAPAAIPDPAVAASFKRLDDAIESRLSAPHDRQAEIDELEARLAVLRASASLPDGILEATRAMASSSFAMFTAGTLSAEAAERIVAGLLLQIGEGSSEPKPIARQQIPSRKSRARNPHVDWTKHNVLEMRKTMSAQQIADKLGCHYGTVWRRLREAEA